MIRKLLAVGALLLAFVSTGSADQGAVRNVEQFTAQAATSDSTEVASNWIVVRGARRVTVRIWSERGAWADDATHASSDADSLYADSLTTFKVLFSDSLSTSGPFAVDSLVFNPALAATYADTALTFCIAKPLPINRALRAPVNGSGLITIVAPINPASASPFFGDAVGFFTKKYMRIRVTPLRRLTVDGFSSTEGLRTNGVKGLHISLYADRGNP